MIPVFSSTPSFLLLLTFWASGVCWKSGSETQGLRDVQLPRFLQFEFVHCDGYKLWRSKCATRGSVNVGLQSLLRHHISGPPDAASAVNMPPTRCLSK
ncbi:hypothetical protein B0H14DRAFT_2734369 [Mycena olivaceomarginata]|nr:hypothetical protein B0H14DRAFT_2734369 [Mycena olivaceomarginata]